jgi:hypothetical protein
MFHGVSVVKCFLLENLLPLVNQYNNAMKSTREIEANFDKNNLFRQKQFISHFYL